MGMYTQIVVTTCLRKDTPEEVIEVLEEMCSPNPKEGGVLDGYPPRWRYLFYSGSAYVPNVSARELRLDKFDQSWYLLGVGNSKNYNGEAEEFFDFIDPWVDACPGELIGYHRYEEDLLPTLVVKSAQGVRDG